MPPTKAEVGDRIVIHTPLATGGKYTKGHVGTVDTLSKSPYIVYVRFDHAPDVTVCVHENEYNIIYDQTNNSFFNV